MTSTILFRLENRAFSVQILEQQGTDKQAMKPVRALYESLSRFCWGIRPWLSKVSCFWVWLFNHLLFLLLTGFIHVLRDREEHDRGTFREGLNSPPLSWLPPQGIPASWKEQGFQPLSLASQLLEAPWLLPSYEYSWKASRSTEAMK